MEVLPIRTPVQSNTAWLARFCEDFYFSSNHESRIKAHTKLADDVGNRVTRFPTGFQLLNKCLRKQEFNICPFKNHQKITFEPDLAMVPKLLMASSLFIPIPESCQEKKF